MESGERNINKSCSLRHQKCPNFPYFTPDRATDDKKPKESDKKKKVFTPFVEASTTMNTFACWCWDCWLSCSLVSCTLPYARCCRFRVISFLFFFAQLFLTASPTAAALSQVSLDHIFWQYTFYGHKLYFCWLRLTTLQELFNFNDDFISFVLAPAQLYDFHLFHF